MNLKLRLSLQTDNSMASVASTAAPTTTVDESKQDLLKSVSFLGAGHMGVPMVMSRHAVAWCPFLSMSLLKFVKCIRVNARLNKR